MAIWTIYHNPRCSKSRLALELLLENGIQPKVVEYLKNPLSTQEILDLFKVVGSDLEEFVRTNEEDFKLKKPSLKDKSKLAQFLSEFPKALQRPIVVHKSKGVIGRPLELIEDMIKSQ